MSWRARKTAGRIESCRNRDLRIPIERDRRQHRAVRHRVLFRHLHPVAGARKWGRSWEGARTFRKSTRTAVGEFSMEQAISLEELAEAKQAGKFADCLIPLESLLTNFPRVNVLPVVEKRCASWHEVQHHDRAASSRPRREASRCDDAARWRGTEAAAPAGFQPAGQADRHCRSRCSTHVPTHRSIRSPAVAYPRRVKRSFPKYFGLSGLPITRWQILNAPSDIGSPSQLELRECSSIQVIRCFESS